jgi:hypothetical protein
MTRLTGPHRKEWDDLADVLDPWQGDPFADATRFEVGERADCCTAQAAYLVVLAACAGTSRRSHVLLCAHHFRAHRQALHVGGADVYDAEGVIVG